MKNNFAYIDGANLHMGISGFGWKLDYRRLNAPIAYLNDQKFILQVK